jgi:hypothetical protein
MGVVLVIPAGALTSDTLITITDVPSSELPPADPPLVMPTGFGVIIEPESILLDEIGSLTFPMSQESLTGMDPETLDVYKWLGDDLTPQGGDLNELVALALDAATNTVTGPIDSLGTYAVLGLTVEDSTALPPQAPIEQPAGSAPGTTGGAGDPSAAGELPETGTGTEAVEQLTMPLIIAGLLALMGALSLAGVEFHRLRQ